VGDLFHSGFNKEHDLFLKWRNDIVNLPIQLIKGNHDILAEEWYKVAGITINQNIYAQNNFTFTHDINDMKADEENYLFSGHIHPGIRISGMGKQTLQLPCFYFTKKYAVLPAFGKFTGTFAIRPNTEDTIFALVENSVIQIQ
jgi:metallophosphoesterase superfamily enzyme